jgi:hypothetical protein
MQNIFFDGEVSHACKQCAEPEEPQNSVGARVAIFDAAPVPATCTLFKIFQNLYFLQVRKVK